MVRRLTIALGGSKTLPTTYGQGLRQCPMVFPCPRMSITRIALNEINKLHIIFNPPVLKHRRVWSYGLGSLLETVGVGTA